METPQDTAPGTDVAASPDMSHALRHRVALARQTLAAGESSVTPWAALSSLATVAGGVGAVVAAGGMPDWSPDQWHTFLGFLSLFFAGLFTAFGTLAVKIIRELRTGRVSVKQDVAASVNATVAPAVNAAVERSQIPTNDKQADEMADRFIRALERRTAASPTPPPADPPLKVQT